MRQRALFGRDMILATGRGDVWTNVIEKNTADDFIRANHYSRSVVWSSNIHLGVFVQKGRSIHLVMVLQFGPAMNPGSGSSVVQGTTKEQWLELNRMARVEEAPDNLGTTALSQAFRLVSSIRPKVQWIQTFADERCGHGGIYQAASLVYVGKHLSKFYFLDGEWFHKSMVGRSLVDKRGWGCGPKIRRFLENADRATVHEFWQYRYIKFLNNRARKRLLLQELPYPKEAERRLA